MKKSYENEIRELLSRMTLEEKIGQLQQCGPSLVGAFEVSFEELLDMMFDGRISQEEFGRLMATTEQDYHEEIRKQVTLHRSGGSNSTNDSMDLFNKMPRFLSKFLIHIVMWLDRHGWVPKAFIADDPYYSTAVISNLGSIKLKCGYHHLTNWGTCSLFCIIGEKGLKPYYDEAGNVTLKETLELGLTIDERLADGYYYSKSVRLLKTLLQNPELLDKPFGEEIEY